MAYEIKKGKRRPYWRVQLTANGSPANITGNAGVYFSMATTATAPLKVDSEPMSVIDAATGVVEYQWQAADTDTAAVYVAEVVVDWGGGEEQGFPSKGYFAIEVYDDIT